MNHIGIGIITRNRRKVFDNTYKHVLKYSPKHSKIIVVDDNSDEPLNSDYRFEFQAGIAKATNKCFELLEDCEHIFIFNDDCFPIDKDMFECYINSKYKHLCYSFEYNAYGTRLSNEVFIKDQIDDINIFNHPNGCMLYIENEVLKKVGGFDTNFGIWGMEHVEFSLRVHNNGITPYPFMDLINSQDLLCSLDYYQAVNSSVPETERLSSIDENIKYFNKVKNKIRFVKWK